MLQPLNGSELRDCTSEKLEGFGKYVNHLLNRMATNIASYNDGKLTEQQEKKHDKGEQQQRTQHSSLIDHPRTSKQKYAIKPNHLTIEEEGGRVQDLHQLLILIPILEKSHTRL